MSFQNDLKNWIEEEKQKLKSNRASMPSIFDTDEFDDDFLDVLEDDSRNLSQLDSIKLEVASSLTPESIIPIALESSKRLLDNIADTSSDVNNKVTALQHGLQNQPELVENKTSLQNISDSLKKFGNQEKREESEQAKDKLMRLLDPELLDQFMEQQKIYTTESFRSIKKVKELRERYYTVDSSDVNIQTRSPIDESDDVIFINDDTDEEVQDVSGYNDVNIDPDGNIILSDRNSQDPGMTIRVEPVNSPRRSSKRSRQKEVKDSLDDVIEELNFESWACVISNMASWIEDRWDFMKRDIDKAIDALNLPQQILDQQSFGTNGFQVISDINHIRNSLNNIISADQFNRDFLGVQKSFNMRIKANDSVGTSTVCDYNKRNYCDVNSRIMNLSAEINLWSPEIPELPDFVQGFNTKEIMVQMSEYFAQIKELVNEIDSVAKDIKADICAFITKKIKGRSKKLTKFQSLLGDLTNILLAFPLNLAQDFLDVERLSNLLNKSGYTAASDHLSSGQVMRFLLTEEAQATSAGKVSQYLFEQSLSQRNPHKSSELRKLARSARIYSEQKTMGQRLRESFSERFNQKKGLDTATAIEDRSEPLLND